VLRSAVANAESTHALDGDELVILAAYADEGPTLKRWRARARGRVNRIRKRTCHITLIVAENPKAQARPKRSAATPATTFAPTPDAPAVDEKPKRKSPAKKKEVAA
jgi:large subunit ribosomal protein L22